jgi:hypothetical protein
LDTPLHTGLARVVPLKGRRSSGKLVRPAGPDSREVARNSGRDRAQGRMNLRRKVGGTGSSRNTMDHTRPVEASDVQKGATEAANKAP